MGVGGSMWVRRSVVAVVAVGVILTVMPLFSVSVNVAIGANQYDEPWSSDNTGDYTAGSSNNQRFYRLDVGEAVFPNGVVLNMTFDQAGLVDGAWDNLYFGWCNQTDGYDSGDFPRFFMSLKTVDGCDDGTNTIPCQLRYGDSSQTDYELWTFTDDATYYLVVENIAGYMSYNILNATFVSQVSDSIESGDVYNPVIFDQFIMGGLNNGDLDFSHSSTYLVFNNPSGNGGLNMDIDNIQIYYASDNYPPSQSGEVPADTSTDISLEPTLSINVSDAEGDLMNISWLTNESGSWVILGTNTSVSNGTYTCTNTSVFNTINTTYYWRVLVSDGSISNETYSFTTLFNATPVVSDVLPVSGCDVTPAELSYNVSDAEGDLMNITILSNVSGSWVTLETYNQVGNGTYNTTNGTSQMGDYGTTYYHRILADDGINSFNQTYSFTTNTAPGQSTEEPTNESTNVEPQAALNITVSDIDGDTMNISWLTNESGSWVTLGTNNSVSNGTYTCTNTSVFNGFLTTYYYRVLVEDAYQVSNKTYHFTTRANLEPALGSLSPANNSNYSIVDSITLSWSATDADGHNITYDVYWGGSGASSLVLANTTGTSLNVGSLSYGVYEYRVVAWDELGAYNDSGNYTFNVLNLTYDCNVWLRHEEDYSNYTLKENYSYALKVFFNDRTVTYDITDNGFNSSLNYTWALEPQYMRLMVYPNETSGYIDYYRGRIPVEYTRVNTTQTYNITFWLPEDESILTRYIFTLDDRSGNFGPPNTWIRIYNYNDTGVTGYIHEDYFTVDLTMTAYLLLNERYYTQIRKASTVYEDNRIIDASATTEQTIIIYPYLPDQLYFYWDIVELSAYHNNDKIIVNYVDDNEGSQYVNISIYEDYNGSETLIYNNNFTSDTVMLSLSGYNTSRYHYANITFKHDDLGVKTVTLQLFVDRDSVVSSAVVEGYIVYFMGSNPLGTWVNIIVGFITLGVVLMFTGKEYAFFAPIAAAMVIFLVQFLIGFNGINSTTAMFLGILGVIAAIKKGGD